MRLLGAHPSDEARAELAEVLQVKRADARIQLPTNEEIIDRIA
jgi:hypothetical protein